MVLVHLDRPHTSSWRDAAPRSGQTWVAVQPRCDGAALRQAVSERDGTAKLDSKLGRNAGVKRNVSTFLTPNWAAAPAIRTKP